MSILSRTIRQMNHIDTSIRESQIISPALVLNAEASGTAGREPQRGEIEVVAEGRLRVRVAHAGLPLLGDGHLRHEFRSLAPRAPTFWKNTRRVHLGTASDAPAS